MDLISIHQAKSSLSQLVSRAQSGETVYIGAYGILLWILAGVGD